MRTNDTLIHRVGVVVGDVQADSATISLSLPAGVQMAALPATCQAGSTLAPAMVTSYAWDTDPTALTPQQITCIVAGPLLAGSTTVFEFSSRVLPGFDQGHVLEAVASVAGTVAGVPYDSGEADAHDTVSAAVKYDVQVMGTKGDPDTGGYVQWEGRYTSCPVGGPTGGPTYSNVCLTMRVPVQIGIPDGGRGSAPLDPTVPVLFDFDMGLDAMFGEGATAHLAALTGRSEADVARFYGARLQTCAMANPYDAPGTAGTLQTQVVNSGTTACTYGGAAAASNPSAYGQDLTVTVTGMNSTAFRVPTLNGNNTAIEPVDATGRPLYGYVYSTAMVVVVPAETLGLLSEWSGADLDAAGRLGVSAVAENLRLGDGTPVLGDDPATDTMTRHMLYANQQTFQNFFTSNSASTGRIRPWRRRRTSSRPATRPGTARRARRRSITATASSSTARPPTRRSTSAPRRAMRRCATSRSPCRTPTRRTTGRPASIRSRCPPSAPTAHGRPPRSRRVRSWR